MTDIWNGEILLPHGGSIKNVGLTSQNVPCSLFLPAAALRFLSTVDPARIPLYLAAGPSLDVWTTDEATEEWFHAMLLSRLVSTEEAGARDWWSCPRSQSPVGILVQLQSQEEHGQSPRVTEILFYGTIAAATDGLPTPPSSSPDDLAEHLPQLRVHALPLSSDLLHHQPVPAALGNEAQFLPPGRELHVASGSPKRKRDIFQEATIARNKARAKGGVGVAVAAAAAAARASESQGPYTHRKSLSIDSKTSPFADSRPPSSRHLSRSPSISSDARVLGRKDQHDTLAKRSNLSRVASVSLQPIEPTTESRNKEALSRVVMAAMRMHGLQQRKKARSRRASIAPGVEENRQGNDEATAEEAAKDEEYKLIYHQTYKGAAFALRKHMSEKPLHAQTDRLGDLVEQLLTIYLNDPLSQTMPSQEPNNSVATPHRLGAPGSAHTHASPFDLPSGTRPPMMRSVTDSIMYTGSPVNRKKNNGSTAAPA